MKKKVALIAAVAAMAVLLLIYPENCLNSARYGLSLWLTAVLPALFPFMAASFLLLETGIVRLIAHIFAPVTRVLFYAPGESAYVFIASAMSGYPVGARLSSELYASKHITEAEAQRIIRFTSVSGPVFMTGTVCTGLLRLPEAGVYLAAAHYLSAIAVGVIFGIFARRQRLRVNDTPRPRFKEALAHFKKDAAKCPPVGEMLANSVEKALIVLLKVGGFIILFSVVLEMLSVTGVMDLLGWVYMPVTKIAGFSGESAKALLYGGVEMTSGCARAAALSLPIQIKLPLIAGIITFGGMCIHMQTTAMMAGYGLRPKGFLLAKSIQAMLAFFFTSLFLSVFPLTAAVSNIGLETKTAAYGGVIFAAAAFAVLIIIKLWQGRAKRSAFPFAR
jgi:sporulation integral membrane protein YlbJ